MKLALHYLKFDWQRWRWLLLMLWVFTLLHTLVTGIAEYQNFDPLADGGNAKVLQWSLTGLRAVALGLALLICHQIGKADSPVRDQTWLMTRPIHRRTLVMARGMFVSGGVVLPLVAGYALLLAMLKFNAATIGNEALHALAFLSSSAVLMLLWSFISTSLAALVLGILTMVCASLTLYSLGLRAPQDWYRFKAHPAVAVIFLTLPALYGVLRMRRRLSRRQWALDGFKMGMMTAVALVLPPLATRIYKHAIPGPLERRAFADSDAEWVMQADRPKQARHMVHREGRYGIVEPDALNPVILARGSGNTSYLGMPLKPQQMPPGVDSCAAEITAVSWRAGPDTEWSAWREAQGRLYSGAGGDDLQGISFQRDGFPSMQNGELRLKAWLTLRQHREYPLSTKAGVIAKGDGWVYELVERRNADGEPVLQSIYRETAAHGEDTSGLLSGNSEGTTDRPWLPNRYRESYLSSFFMRTHHANVWQPLPGSESAPSSFSITATRTEETRQRIIRLTGLNVAVSEQPEKVEPPRQQRPAKPPPVLRDEPFQEKLPAYPWPLTSNSSAPIQ